MALPLPNVNFQVAQGGLGRRPANNDYISGLIAYIANADLPAGFSTTDRIKRVFSLPEAESLGINLDYTDETKATGTYTVTNVGSNGDTIELFVPDPSGTPVSLGVYTKSASETNSTQVAAAIVAIINAGTFLHGYTASNSSGVITVTAKASLGVFLNGLSMTATIVGGITGSIAAFSGGVASKIAVLHYHVSEYFRLMPNGQLYIGIYAAYGTNFEEVATIQNYAEGTIRQLAIMNDLSTAFSTTQVTKIQAQCQVNFDLYRPMVAVFAPEISGTSSISSLPNLSTLDSEKVSVIISQDAGARGKYLWQTVKKSISDIGAKLGVLSLSRVSESWAWLGAYNMSDGTELDTIGFSNGELYSAISASALNSVNEYAYCYLRKVEGLTGSYNNQPNTCTLLNSDFRFIYANRTIQKAIRLARAGILPQVSGPVILNANGTLPDWQVENLKTLSDDKLIQMISDGEISAGQTLYDPAQNVLSTNEIVGAIEIVPVGVSDQFKIKIGFVTRLTQA